MKLPFVLTNKELIARLQNQAIIIEQQRQEIESLKKDVKFIKHLLFVSYQRIQELQNGSKETKNS